MSANILVVDDQPLPRQALANELRDAGFRVSEAADGAEGWQRFCENSPDVVVTDLAMPIADGLNLLSRIRSQSEIPVIVFSAYGTIQSTAAAFKGGATDFLSSTEVEIDDIVKLVTNAAGAETAVLHTGGMERIFVGESTAMRQLRERLAALASMHIPVFISGESGSGCTAAIRAIHDLGATAGTKLVKLDPTAPIPDLRSIDAGAVSLNELESLTTETLAQWSQELASIESVGFASAPRIFVTTRWPLSAWLCEPSFREGLGQFLLRSAVEIPPLSAHPEDVPSIAVALCGKISKQLGRKMRLSPAALDYIAAQSWTGQVRALEQVLERAATFSRGHQVRRDVVADVMSEHMESVDTYREIQMARERSELLDAIQNAGGNISRAAAKLGRSRSAIYRMMTKHKISLKRKG